MLIAATHTTTYEYLEPVTLEPHLFRMRPRDYCALASVLAFSVLLALVSFNIITVQV